MGEVSTYFLDLPYPPSVNTYWRRVGHKTIISRKGRAYLDQVKAILAKAKFKMLKGSIELRIVLWMPDRRKRDIDNILKALLDSLEKGGAVKDDNQVDKLTVERGGVMKGGRVLLEIIER